MRHLRFTALFLLGIAPVAATAAPPAALSGTIAGVHGGVGVLWHATTGSITPLPEARNPGAISLSPDGSTVLYFLPIAPGDDTGPFVGRAAWAPFTEDVAVGDADGRITTDGGAPRIVWVEPDRASVSAYQKQWWYDAARRRATPAREPVESASDNGWIAYSTDTEIHVHRVATGLDRTVFDIRKSAALLEAVSRLRPRSRVRDLQDGYDADMARAVENWTISTAAISHDGRSVYFLSNCGTGQGEQGNATMGFVRVDLQTGATRILDQLGVVFGRPPAVFALSPDGKRLLVATSAHNSAADNSFTVKDVDIATGASVDLLAKDYRSRSLANEVDGACWSPDSRFVAVSVRYYDASASDADSTPQKPDMEIKDATTGRTVRTVSDFGQPSWER